ncbi:MAG: BON domain-containing protein [Pseudomonadota bacterium]
MIRFILLAVAASSLFLTTGCGGILLGAGATAGTAAAQEGGISRALSDTEIQALINDKWLKHNVDMFRKLDLTVNQGRVLITGVVQKQEHRVDAVRLAWQVKNVKQVINEIKVANSEGIQGFVRDNWISSQLRTKLIWDKQVQSINYSIDTVQATIYLMGVAQNQRELDRVVEIARTIKGVRGVVSYVKLVGEKVEGAGAVATDTDTPTQLYRNPTTSTSTSPVAPVESVEREPAN